MNEPLDPVLRLHLLAAALPGSVLAERILAAPFDQVWGVVTDLETMAPRYESNVRAVEIIERSPAEQRIIASLRSGRTEEMDVRMVPGWCLMQAPSFVIAFGARPEGAHTRLAHLEHSRAVPMDTAAPGALLRELDTIETLAAGEL